MGDVRQALRAIARMPGLAFVIVVSLGVGIGVNTVVFSWIQARLLSPLPGVPGSGAYRWIEPRTDAGLYPGVSWPDYRDLQERMTTFGSLVAFRMAPFYVGKPGDTERVSGVLVSDNYFETLSIRPAVGRFFRPQADSADASMVVISHEMWQTRFAGATDVAERTVRVNGQELPIAGVTPAGFQGTVVGLEFALWVPARLAPLVLNGSRELLQRGARGYAVMGTLAPGRTDEDAQAELDAAMRELAERHPATNVSLGGEVLGFSQSPRGPQRFLNAALLLLQSILLLLLLAVCGNTATLLLARATARRREVGVRLALGASRWRIARLLLTETMMLGVAGALAGALFAVWGTEALRASPPMRGLPIRFQTEIDGLSLAVALSLGLAGGALAGVVPAVHLARLSPLAAMRAGTGHAGAARLRHALMAVQVAVALVVLIAAALIVEGFVETRSTDPGFRRDGVLLASYDLGGSPTTDAAARTFVMRMLQQVRALPGVEDAAVAASVPLDIHGMPQRFFSIEGRARPDGTLDQALANTVTPGYFDLMGIPIVAGATFAPLDDIAAGPQVVVNQEFARRYLDGRAPLGLSVLAGGRTYAVAGVSANSLNNAFGEPPTPIIYFSARDRPAASGHLHVRTRPGSEAALAAAIRHAVRELDPGVPLFNLRTMNEHVESNLIFRRVPARMFAVIGPLLVVLTAIGIYAAVAYHVSLRATDIAVQLALGAPARRLVGRIVGQNLIVVGLGAAAGTGLAIVLAPAVSPRPALSGTVMAGVPVMMMGVAAVASWLPARRGCRIDPALALKQGSGC